jgi:uncharacterized membrane protein
MSSEHEVFKQHHNRLFEHKRHPHTPRNVNEVHAEERQGINDCVAVWLTSIVGSMPTAYLFALLACVGLAAILGWLSPLVAILVAWLSQTMIQLTLLPIIMVGQNVLGRHAEIQADEQFKTVGKTYHDLEQMALHLQAQDAEMLKHAKILEEHTKILEEQNTELIKQTGLLIEILAALPPRGGLRGNN